MKVFVTATLVVALVIAGFGFSNARSLDALKLQLDMREDGDGTTTSESSASCTCVSNPSGRDPTGFLTTAGSFTVVNKDKSALATSSRLKPHLHPVNKFVLHTAEGRWKKSDGTFASGSLEAVTRTLDKKKYWTHFAIGRDNSGTVAIWQYYPMDKRGRGLRDGNSGAIQVEVCGKAAHPFTDNDPDLTAATKALIQAVSAASGGRIPNCVDSKVVFESSNKAYGLSAPVRLDKATYNSVAGVVGHQHVFDNTHWDPGKITPSKIVNKVCTGNAGSTSGGSSGTPTRDSDAGGACNGAEGVCIDTNTQQCSIDTLSRKCPGGSNVKCCPTPGEVSDK